MSKSRRNLTIAGVLIGALTGFLATRHAGPRPIELAGPGATVAEGYERIQPLRNQIAGESQLAAGIVELERRDGQLQVSKILFTFAPTRIQDNGNRLITVDNASRTAYFSATSPWSPSTPATAEGGFAPIDAAPIPTDVPDVRNAAKDNGLNEFCSLVPPKNQHIEVRLRSGRQGPLWHVIGDGTSDSGSAAELLVVVDAQTGAVVRQRFEKGANAVRGRNGNADTD